MIKTTDSTVTVSGQSICLNSFIFSMESVTEEGVLIREQGIVPTGRTSVLLLEPRLREREERGREERGRESLS